MERQYQDEKGKGTGWPVIEMLEPDDLWRKNRLPDAGGVSLCILN
ncbi:hypothetical protein [Pantoea agglomerans]|nr:hypothetical protein [Pantoea agglomerans]